MINSVLNGDCLELMKDIPNQSIHMILCDLPYGTTACKWDIIIPFDKLWEQYERIIKPNGVICLFGSEPFSSYLRLSNIKKYKYDWIWKKSPFNFLNSSHQPLRNSENISVFYKKCEYYAVEKDFIKWKTHGNYFKKTESVGDYKFKSNDYIGYAKPTTIIEGIKKEDTRKIFHPTQKPVALFEYLIKTYTKEGYLILDNCAGSGTTAIACLNTNRNYILMEQDKGYFDLINKRIAENKNLFTK